MNHTGRERNAGLFGPNRDCLVWGSSQVDRSSSRFRYDMCSKAFTGWHLNLAVHGSSDSVAYVRIIG
jgi:hypothetical protein